MLLPVPIPSHLSCRLMPRTTFARLMALLHELRHSWATLAMQQGIHVKLVQERLGHSTVAITLGTYSHVSPTMQRDAAQVVAAAFLG